ncbi:MAG: hypothetical protein A2945_02000 [Candidatus Liptonbacteria bacterium RIFCSPLOWO2_01_FULL_52_25]|uniref:SHOCT domain-containing protein n=1 Tax=Candidatus Liptonbacteria bacterium RIFCSPLOWO2_01_FULL_52_25 TaxID=1798650 RepID=A0A1G2CG84_9BACT|nr:MAG: hypothetical protein A2945_02000 [Candidatus Liptonbacteria bacterium RIFCSPLOWO2_01_FULL_52_25]
MKTIRAIAILIVFSLFGVAAASAAQQQDAAPPASSQQQVTTPAPPQQNVDPAPPPKVAKPLGGDTVFKQHSGRAHRATGTIPRNKVVAITRHMRDVGYLTDEEYHALLEFLAP